MSRYADRPRVVYHRGALDGLRTCPGCGGTLEEIGSAGSAKGPGQPTDVTWWKGQCPICKTIVDRFRERDAERDYINSFREEIWTPLPEPGSIRSATNPKAVIIVEP